VEHPAGISHHLKTYGALMKALIFRETADFWGALKVFVARIRSDAF
jgi:hypothetical protein